MTPVEDMHEGDAGAAPPAAAHPLGGDLNWLLHRVAGGLGSVLEQVARRHGASLRGHLVLTTIAASPPMTQLALGGHLSLDKTAVTAVLDTLESQGWIVRRPAPCDRRARVSEVTPAGRDLIGRVHAEVERATAEVVADLSAPEREQLVHLLQKLVFGHFAAAAPAAGSCL